MLIPEDDVRAGKRLLRAAGVYAPALCRVAVGMLGTVGTLDTLVTLVAVAVIATKRATRTAAAELLGGAVLGVCFHPAAATVVGSVAVLIGAALYHCGREPEPQQLPGPLKKAAPTPSPNPHPPPPPPDPPPPDSGLLEPAFQL